MTTIRKRKHIKIYVFMTTELLKELNFDAKTTSFLFSEKTNLGKREILSARFLLFEEMSRL